RSVPFRISSSAERSSFSCRLEMRISAPASTRPRAIALPSPLLPPVTRATLPVRSNSLEIMVLSVKRAEGTCLSCGVDNIGNPGSLGQTVFVLDADAAPRYCPPPYSNKNIVGGMRHGPPGSLARCGRVGDAWRRRGLRRHAATRTHLLIQPR